MRVNRSLLQPLPTAACDHTDRSFEYTEQFLTERAVLLKRPGKSYVKAYRMVEHPFNEPSQAIDGAVVQYHPRFVKPSLSRHASETSALEDEMLSAAYRAVRRADDLMFSYNMEPQTHGLKLLKETFIDGNRIKTRVSIYVYRLS